MSTSSARPSTNAELEAFIARSAGIPEALVRPVARLLCSDILPAGSWAECSVEELCKGARRAIAQVRAESRAFEVWELRRRAFSLGGTTEDRLWLELLRDNQPQIERCQRTLHELRQVLDEYEGADNANYFQAA